MLLQPNRGPVPGDRYLAADPESVSWGWVPTAGAEPAVVVEPGSTLTIDTVSHEGILGDQGRDPVAFFGRWGVGPAEVLDDARELAAGSRLHDQATDGPHVITGPVAVRGAEPGDVIEVRFLDLLPRCDYGIVSNRHGRGALAGSMPLAADDGVVPPVVSVLARITADSGGTRGLLVPWRTGGVSPTIPVSPFVGLVAVAGADDAPIHSTAPGDHGGNLDVADLGAGSSILLPVRTPGGLVSFGDPHFAQGNGEVALTAWEAPLRVTARFDLHRGGRVTRLARLLDRPFGDTGTHLVIVGLGDDLDGAMRDAVDRAVRVLGDGWGVDPHTALAYLSAAADFEVSQVVNGVKGVHCLIRHQDLERIGSVDE